MALPIDLALDIEDARTSGGTGMVVTKPTGTVNGDFLLAPAR